MCLDNPMSSDEHAQFETQQTCTLCGCARFQRLIAWRSASIRPMTRWFFTCPECDSAVIATQRRPGRIVISRPEISPYSPFLETLRQDLCPATRLYKFDISRDAFRCGATAYDGPFFLDYRHGRPAQLDALRETWRAHGGVSDSHTLDIVWVERRHAVAFDPVKGRLYGQSPATQPVRFVPTDSGDA